MGINNIKTDERLLQALFDSAKREQSDDERKQQRVSFVFGSLDSESDVTREQVRVALAKEGISV